MTDDLLARARKWAEDDPDQHTAAELHALIARGDLKELAERMAGPLAFGTAGLRGVLGAGESRMNRAVVRRTTAGLAVQLLASCPTVRQQGVIVGYDGRRMSREFALDVAQVLAARDIPALLFPALCPTPLVAFAVLDQKAAAGVVVTASHNPPEYNGYKIYAANGAQIIPPQDREIAEAMAAVGPAKEIPLADEPQARAAGLIRDVDPSVIERYLDTTLALQRDRRGRHLVRIVYTPLHGTGDRIARELLARAGFEQVWSVPEQQEPNENFPTVAFPNPEEKGALDLAFALASQKQATLVLANDPDADRLAVAVPDGQGGFRQLTGNEVGVLLGEYALRHAEGGDRRLVVTTVVSSPMLKQIASQLRVRYGEVLTGFKWITNLAMRREAEEGASFVFGYEEALGYTVGTAVRDKDGLSAALVFAELTAAAAAEGRTVLDELERLGRTYGLFVSAQRNVTYKGVEGAAEIASLLDRLRDQPPSSIHGLAVRSWTDVLRGVRFVDGREERVELPESNVLIFDLEGGARVVARPSGTEPKIKYYFDLREQVLPGEPYSKAHARAEARLATLIDGFLLLFS
ncbi:MAG: phospho-sugar mutase [Myxococcales bacterium]|nr:phospho-sugar mutase [Polyangiaceae bacterium]MDW8250996.1 phospho-sugar mutase [Myxococcales bacterium]